MSTELTKENAADRLRELFPHGHPAFLPTTLREIQLHSDKNHDYAKGGNPLGNFERVAAILALYPKLRLSDMRVVALIYALKQVDAVLWGLSEGIEHKVEGLNDRLQDISVYSKIVMCMNGDLQTGAATDLPTSEPAVGERGLWYRGRKPVDAADRDLAIVNCCDNTGSHNGATRLCCTRTKGHTGDHVGHYSSGLVGGRWAQ